MSDLKGTQTEKNLEAAFAGESQAHTKYQYFAAKAKEEGYVQSRAAFGGFLCGARGCADHGVVCHEYKGQHRKFTLGNGRKSNGKRRRYDCSGYR